MPTSNGRNVAAFVALIVAKISGLVGLALGYTSHRTEAALLLTLDGVLLVTAVVLCIQGMRARVREDEGHKQALAQMIREGTLNQYLRELKDAGETPNVPKLSSDDASTPS